MQLFCKIFNNSFRSSRQINQIKARKFKSPKKDHGKIHYNSRSQQFPKIPGRDLASKRRYKKEAECNWPNRLSRNEHVSVARRDFLSGIQSSQEDASQPASPEKERERLTREKTFLTNVPPFHPCNPGEGWFSTLSSLSSSLLSRVGTLANLHSTPNTNDLDKLGRP